ncbi:glycosyltransferase family 2 protein [Cupriavidus taiwanensis]|uniref:ABC-type polysaccharide/polyol phosphate transport system, ATPase component n=1 Tax=Cupriavidus taiwanensis TaxID=164546 RepID=A0A7Z7NM26_9BURK
MNGITEWELDADEELIVKPAYANINTKYPLVALTRIRNEADLIVDTLDHVSKFADAIIVYDDASDDGTFDMAWAHTGVVGIIRNHKWRNSIEERLLSETRHRGLLLTMAKRYFAGQWYFCFDADERYVGDIRSFVRSSWAARLSSVRIRLFDAYITGADSEPYIQGNSLLNFRKFFGPEYRDIRMLWKGGDDDHYTGLDSREPIVPGPEDVLFYCQHYGKSLSIQHWNATCEYYVKYFPYEPYGRKWQARMGKAIHDRSDFDAPLYAWGGDLFGNARPMI